jgi:hypothetical protein
MDEGNDLVDLMGATQPPIRRMGVIDEPVSGIDVRIRGALSAIWLELGVEGLPMLSIA